MMKKISENVKMFRVNVYYEIENADNFFGSDFIDVVNEIYLSDDESGQDLMMKFKNEFQNHKGYTVCVIPFEENENNEGWYKIR